MPGQHSDERKHPGGSSSVGAASPERYSGLHRSKDRTAGLYVRARLHVPQASPRTERLAPLTQKGGLGLRRCGRRDKAAEQAASSLPVRLTAEEEEEEEEESHRWRASLAADVACELRRLSLHVHAERPVYGARFKYIDG